MNSRTRGRVFSGVGIQGTGVAKVSETITLMFEDDGYWANVGISG